MWQEGCDDAAYEDSPTAIQLDIKGGTGEVNLIDGE
jgi:hypothetical protein